MQLRVLIGLLVAMPLAAQNNAAPNQIDANFLFNYYNQDGEHAAVTGGTGTEELSNVGPMLIINIPLKNNRSLGLTTGFDAYSSASTDAIDFEVSSASSKDVRVFLNASYQIGSADGTQSYGFSLGGSAEYDYSSGSIGANWTRTSEDGNRQFSIAGQFIGGKWITYYPEELRGQGELVDTKRRYAASLTLSYAQVINQRLQAAITVDVVRQQGLLSTPFHRVYFPDEALPRLETLPDSRLKLPVGLRVTWFATDALVARLYYRYYSDDFDLAAHTADIELPWKVNQRLTLAPFYRHHDQRQAKYFAAFSGHSPDARYFTSDYDLSGFISRKWGLAVKYAPVWGIGSMNLPLLSKLTTLKSASLRYARYTRTDGLGANSFSLDLGFTLQ